jgi:hypothetical protein
VVLDIEHIGHVYQGARPLLVVCDGDGDGDRRPSIKYKYQSPRLQVAGCMYSQRGGCVYKHRDSAALSMAMAIALYASLCRDAHIVHSLGSIMQVAYARSEAKFSPITQLDGRTARQ